MAEGSIDPLVTPEDNQLDDGNIRKNKSGNSGSLSNGRTRAHHLRASIGSYHVGDRSMRNSIEISNSVNNSPKKVPHYLRASTGSCHDFCKYGRDHAFQEKPWKPLRKKTAKPLHNESPEQIIVSGEQKKEKIVKHKPSVLANNHLSNPKSSPDTKSFSPKARTSSDKEKIVKHNPLTDIKIRLPNTKSHLPKPKKSLDTVTYSSRQNDSSGNKTHFPKYKPSPAKKSPSLDPPEIIKRVLFPSKKVEVPVKQGSSTDNKMSGTEKKTGYMTGEYSSSVKSCGPINIFKPTFSSANPDGIREKVRRNSDVGIGRKTTEPKAYTKKASTPPPSATLSPKLPVKIAPIKSRKAGNLKIPSPLKNRNRKMVETETSNNEKVSVKTLHVIETETENNLLESTPDEHTIPSFPPPSSSKLSSHSKSSSLSSHKEDDEETEYSVSEVDGKTILVNKEAMEIVKVQPVKKKVLPVKDNHNKTLRKSRVVVSEAKNSSPVKLKFRSGKVVDLQSENNTPRRLRFRRARAQSEEGKGDLRRRTLKRAEVNDDAAGAELSSEKSVLKHQDVQGKKDAQGLFNNLLESTPDEHTIPSFPSPSSSKLSSHSKSSSLSSHEDDDEETECSVSEVDEKTILDNKEAMEIVKVQPVKKKVQLVKDNHNKTLRKNRVVVSEVKSSSPVKLKFRSGKVVDLQSENNTPRRLKFRRARAQSEESKVDSRRRTLKKAEVNGDATGAELSSKKIVLKHQDVQGKKDAQGLFNNVIEETASKLVESRKSKVRALVGAFETVISLQESSKPSVQPVN